MRKLASIGLVVITTGLAACNREPIGGGDETDTGDPGDGDGDDPGDGDPGDGDGDDPGDGDGEPSDCPPPPQSPVEVEFDYQLTITNNPNFAPPLDLTCTIISLSPGTAASLELTCFDGTGVELEFAVTPGLELAGQPGDLVHLWMYPSVAGGVWLRLDFPEVHGILIVVDGDLLVPPYDDAYFPPPWGLTSVDDCGPIDDGCGVIRPQQIGITVVDQSTAVWADDHDHLQLGDAHAELWVARADEIIEISPVCDPTPEFFRSYKLMIHSTVLQVEGEVCFPGESDPCATGLHCCYPCGIEGCDFVCTPENPNTKQCPPPPP